MGTHKANYTEGLDSELAGLAARRKALPKDDDGPLAEMLDRRIGEVQAEVKRRPGAKERRPGGAPEARPG